MIRHILDSKDFQLALPAIMLVLCSGYFYRWLAVEAMGMSAHEDD